jgi:hypothetical protein
MSTELHELLVDAFERVRNATHKAVEGFDAAALTFRLDGERAGADDLLGYFDAVHAATVAYVRSISVYDLDRVVDRSWDPPVTLGVRLVSVVADNLQHAGQAALIRDLAVGSLS